MRSPNVVLLAIVAYCFLASRISGTNATRQQLIFYGGANCTGQNETVTSTDRNLESRWVTNATSVRIIGLWKITLFANRTGQPVGGPIVTRGDAQPPTGVCASKDDLVNQPDWDIFYFVRAELFGPVDLTTPQITFFTSTFFNGGSYQATRETARLTNTARPLAMQSVMYFSNTSWLAYPEYDFGGKPTCFRPGSESRDGFTYNSTTNITVGSLRPVDCTGDEDPEDWDGTTPSASDKIGLTTFILCSLLFAPILLC